MGYYSYLPGRFSQEQSILELLDAQASGAPTNPVYGQSFAGIDTNAVNQSAFISGLSQIDGITMLDASAFSQGWSSGIGNGGSGTGTNLASAGTVLTTYTAGASNGALGYDIVIEFKGTGWTYDLQQAFIVAADYLTKVIYDDIGGGGLYRGKYVDDLFITAELKAIDGTGGILGQAGPTAVWTATELTAVGKMQFDSADAISYYSKGLWDEIVTHEMMHVLGFGSLWNYGINPLVKTAGQYTGAAGLAVYDALYPGTQSYIPVETDGGSGTAGAHWDEQTLQNELMTGYINGTNYLSEFSVKSLQDLGYHVNYAAAVNPWATTV